MSEQDTRTFWDRFGGGAAALLTVLLFGRTLWHPLVWDDVPLLQTQVWPTGWDGLARVLGGTFWGNLGLARAQGDFYRPLATLTFWLDHLFWGDRPLGFHLTSLLVAAFGAWLLFQLLRSRGFPPLSAATASLLFAAHPLHTEAIPLVADRTDLLAFAAFLGFLWYGSRAGKRPVRTGLALACLGLSLAAKEVALIAPLALAWDRAFQIARSGEESGTVSHPRSGVPARGKPTRIGKDSIPSLLILSALVVLGFLALRTWVLGSRPAAAAVLAGMPGILPTSLLYGNLLWWPFGVRTEYGYPPMLPPPAWMLGGLGWLVLLGLALLPAIPRRARWASGLAVLAILPGLFPGLAAARALYFASAFHVAAVVAVLELLPARPVRVALAGLLVAFGTVSSARLARWSTSLTLFRTCALEAPRVARAWVNYGVALEQVDSLPAAESALQRALELDPNHEKAWNNLALVLRRQSKYDESTEASRRSLALEPMSADAHFNLAVSLLQMGQPGNAAREYRAGLALRRDPRGQLGLGVALSEAGDHEGALESYRAYLSSRPPDSLETRGSIGWELFRLGWVEEAEREARAAVRAGRPAGVSWFNLGAILLSRGEGGEAPGCYERGMQADPSGESWAAAAGDVVQLLRDGKGAASAHFVLGQFAGRAGMPQAQAREGQRALAAHLGGPHAAQAQAWAARFREADAIRERELAPEGRFRELHELFWAR